MKYGLLTALLLICWTLTGCVERLIKVSTDPPGALVWLNDQEVGVTPVTVPFTWYGRYELAVRKQGFQTIKTSRKTPVPLYQWPILDFFSETLLPFRLVDRHHWHYQLTPTSPTDTDALIERAQALRDEALTTD
jgi:hypothetical protein